LLALFAAERGEQLRFCDVAGGYRVTEKALAGRRQLDDGSTPVFGIRAADDDARWPRARR
jgi:hypothetical protein